MQRGGISKLHLVGTCSHHPPSLKSLADVVIRNLFCQVRLAYLLPSLLWPGFLSCICCGMCLAVLAWRSGKEARRSVPEARPILFCERGCV